MSVRRLDPVQPASFAFSADNLAWAAKAIAKYPPGKQASAVIPLLWRAQEQNDGWVSRAAIETVATMLGMSYIRVLEVATFYTMFQLSPVGKRAHIQVCGTTPCMLRGAGELIKVCQNRIHHEPHHLNADGSLSWEEVECLGACVNAPMVQVFKDTYEDLTPAALERLIDEFAAGKTPKPGPQNGRQFSAPDGGPTALIDPAIYDGNRTYVRVEAPPAQPAPAAPAQVPIRPPEVIKPAEAASPDKVVSPVKPIAEQEVVKITNPDAPAPIRLSEQTPQPARGDAADAPELLTAPRAGAKADDLKLIWGVGPKLETLLNTMGIWHFDQVAKWTARELAWVDSRLEGFKGRATRDDWVGQSAKLATGWRPEGSAGDKPNKK